MRALLKSGAPVITLVAKSHDRHVELAPPTTLEENLEMVRDTCGDPRGGTRQAARQDRHPPHGLLDRLDARAQQAVGVGVFQGQRSCRVCLPTRCHSNLYLASPWRNDDTMDLTPYVDNLRRELAVAAEAGGEETRELAERLTTPLESATRLTLLSVLSAAVDEITRELAPGSVDLRLRGLDPDFVVTPPPTDGGTLVEHAAPVEPSRTPVPADGDEGGTARVNLRLPAHLKARAEEAASREGLSVNAWLVRAVAAAVDGGTGPRTPERTQTVGQSFTGWVR